MVCKVRGKAERMDAEASKIEREINAENVSQEQVRLFILLTCHFAYLECCLRIDSFRKLMK
jgi:hypothetical protein